MNNSKFCHLHLHSVHSQLDGLGRAEDYTKKCNELGFKYLAATEHGNIDGLIKFQKVCKDNNIIPILGSELYVVKEYEKKSPRGHMTVWIKNLRGFKNLCKMLSIANLEGFYYKPRVSFEILLKYHKGLIFSSACAISYLNLDGGIELFHQLLKIKKDDIYLEIMPHNFDFQIKHNKKIIKLAKKTGCKVICTADCHYVNKRDWKAHEVLLAMQRKAKWTDKNRWKFEGKGYYLKTANEIIKELKDIGFYKREYLTNTIEIAKKCENFTIPKQDIKLPHVPDIDPHHEDEKLWKLCINGYQKRFHNDIRKNKVYHDRLKFEFNIVKHKNFIRYFLIIYELCSWCKQNNIPVGPRGSCAGSLMAYCLGITTVDPIEHDLIFDRFINEERIDYPDIDMDFPDNKRHLIKEHLEQLYGENKIAGISSYSRMQPRASIQGVARVFDVPKQEVNAFTKLIDEKFDDNEIGKIQNAIDSYPECQDFANKYPKVIKFAKALEGNISNYGKHAAGLVVSIKDIAKTGRCVLMEKKGVRVINWEKDDAEYVGLMKLDALGLKQLSIIQECLDLIKRNHNRTVNLDDLNLDDKKVLKDISNGNTVGIFQLNTWGITNLVKSMGVEKFSHISDAIALYRPGPLQSGMVDEYVERKNGAKWKHKNDIYEEITKDTFGICTYQEHIIFVINKVAGLPYSTADIIRKIISKKRDKKKFELYEKQFFDGCKKTKLFSVREAKRFWEDLQGWSRYGFNKAHSISYAIVAYWTAFLKHYYPTEFICASLTHGAKDKKSELIEEAYRLGLSLKLPKVGISDPLNWVAKDNCLFVPFVEVETIGPKKAVETAKSISTNDANGIASFYQKSEKSTLSIQKHKGKLGELLESIGAYDSNDIKINEDIEKLFKFRIMLSPKSHYTKLYKLFNNNIELKKLDNILSGNSKELKKLAKTKRIIRPKIFQGFDDLVRCEKCLLRNECTRPVNPSPGQYNIMIAGEAPGKDENDKGKGFIGRSGELIWKYLKLKGYKRELFHISNICKCYPAESRRPSNEQIKICTDDWLKYEIKKVKPRIILAFGNTNRQFFEGINSGITSISGKTIWHEKYQAWVCYCVHPASTLHNSDNKIHFNNGMKNFVRMLKILGKDILK